MNFITNDNLNFVNETFSENEIVVLNKFFTNVDKPVFGLINLSDVVKGALFARYSRSNKSLRRLFLDEFYALNEHRISDMNLLNVSNIGKQRATLLYDKMILDFGDDSVAQLGGAHIACEQASNVLTKILEKGRINSYLEQSTRYIYYNDKINGKFNYVIPHELIGSDLEVEYCEYIDLLFNTYTSILNKLVPILKKKYPKGIAQSDKAWESIIRAKACDLIRGLLPAATRSNLGIYANGQSFEYLLIKMFASNNAEVIEYANMMLVELRKIIPSFLTRVDIEDRGKAWSNYIKKCNLDVSRLTDSITAERTNSNICQENKVELLSWDSNAVEKVLKSILFEYSSLSDSEIKQRIIKLSDSEKKEIIQKYCGDRLNRRHKPGRAFECVYYQFEITSDYGAFRDLQRHRMLTIQWQKLSPQNGYIIPKEFDDMPDLRQSYESALRKVEGLYNKILCQNNEDIAQYVIPFAYRVRYSINMNLREAFHFLELRSQKQGHYSYRKISIDMYNLIKNKAGHYLFGEIMNFVDTNIYELAREDAENIKFK